MNLPTNLHDLISAAAVRTPGALALAGPCGTATYRELDDRVNVLARALSGHGVNRGDRVLVWSPKSADAIAATQAALRLGAVYVPLDPATAAERVTLIARQSGARALCAPAELLDRVPAAHDELHCIDLAATAVGPSTPVSTSMGPDDLAYILYTSGSTGTPKGVCISHRNALAFVSWAVAELRAEPQDRFANHASFTFDLSVLDLYAAFATGATVCPVPAEFAYAPKRLVEFLYQERISIWYSVPSVLTLMQRDGGLLGQPPPPALRAVLFAGEPFPIRHVRQLSGWTSARLLNLYGPTETNVCTFHEVRAADLRREVPVPIGRGCSGDRVWARAADGRVTEPGEEGELIVDGPTVFLGYWGQEPQRGPYATGDRVRLRANGAFDFLGRRDGIVKVRGHRIEIGEVTAVIQAHPEVADAAVIARGEGLDRRLAAFVSRRTDDSRDPAARLGAVSLRRHLAAWLPRHAIPDDIHFREELPRTSRGKLDLAALLNATHNEHNEGPQ